MASDEPPVLEVRDLRRHYGRLRPVDAVRGVSFSVRRGDVFGLIGPDGAGKTSIIQMLAGVLTPHGGSALVEGFDVAARGHRGDQVGYMPQGLGSNLYDSLTVEENIEFFRDLRRLPAALYVRNRAELLAATRLEPFLHRRAVDLSGGMRQKLALICTLIHLPDVLLLDEPTTGVDPISRQDFWHIIRRVVEERHATVLVSTSYMDEAERCHRIALLHAGAIVAEGTPSAIRAQARGRFARLTAEPQTTAFRLLRGFATVGSSAIFGDEIHIQFSGQLRHIETMLTAQGVVIRSLSVQEPGLEDVFLQLVDHEDRPDTSRRIEAAPAPDRATSLECRAVSRRFGGFTAVEAVDLSLHRGEIFGLLGPNGAGKTTLIKMMCGLIEPTSGTIAVGGLDVATQRERVWTAIGYMSQRFSLYPDLSVRQNLRLYADLYALDPAAGTESMTWMGLQPFASRLTKDLPVGVRQRLSLLCAVLHRPAIVFLDEPTSGVDPQARRIFWDLIYTLSRDAGVTVLVSTHYMDEAVHCDRLALMHQGRLIAEGSPARLKQRSEEQSGRVLAIRAASLERAHDVLRRAHPGAVVYGDHLRVRSVSPEADIPALTALLVREAVDRVRVEIAPISMDEAFIDFIQTAEAAHV
jgi:ABC-2 type transport system ATP-binding protein